MENKRKYDPNTEIDPIIGPRRPDKIDLCCTLNECEKGSQYGDENDREHSRNRDGSDPTDQTFHVAIITEH
jgi:hypothetical protein